MSHSILAISENTGLFPIGDQLVCDRLKLFLEARNTNNFGMEPHFLAVPSVVCSLEQHIKCRKIFDKKED